VNSSDGISTNQPDIVENTITLSVNRTCIYCLR